MIAPVKFVDSAGSAAVPDPQTGLTTLLIRMRQGDRSAADRAMSAVYVEIHRLAQRFMSGENREHTLQPTALVNEAYVRLMSGPEEIADRHHFLALAAQAMRRVLVDHARQRRAGKRGGGAVHVNVDEYQLGSKSQSIVDVLALDKALDGLGGLDPNAAKIIELRFFGGYTDKEVCEILGESFANVRRLWEFGRAWLKHKMESDRSL